jgi:hypothetical protein
MSDIFLHQLLFNLVVHQNFFIVHVFAIFPIIWYNLKLAWSIVRPSDKRCHQAQNAFCQKVCSWIQREPFWQNTSRAQCHLCIIRRPHNYRSLILKPGQGSTVRGFSISNEALTPFILNVTLIPQTFFIEQDSNEYNLLTILITILLVPVPFHGVLITL